MKARLKRVFCLRVGKFERSWTDGRKGINFRGSTSQPFWKDNHLEVPEICLEDRKRLVLIPLHLSDEHGWRKLDDQSAWKQFTFKDLPKAERLKLLQARVLKRAERNLSDRLKGYLFDAVMQLIYKRLMSGGGGSQCAVRHRLDGSARAEVLAFGFGDSLCLHEL